MAAKLTKQTVDEAIRLVKGGATNRDVYSYLGIVESTFYEWLKHPKNDLQKELSEGMKKAETERKLWHLQRIHKAAEEGDWKASAWYLERRYPQEYARTQRITGEVTTTQKSDALTEAIESTVKRMEHRED